MHKSQSASQEVYVKKQLDFGLNDINKIIEDCFRNPLKLYTEKINTLAGKKDITVMFRI